MEYCQDLYGLKYKGCFRTGSFSVWSTKDYTSRVEENTEEGEEEQK